MSIYNEDWKLWAVWECLDSKGRRWVWSHKPLLDTYQGREIWSVQEVPDSRCQCLTEGGPIPNDWRQTLGTIHA